MSIKKYPAQQITVNGEEITYHRINNDVNGNPRYVIHFLALNVEPKDYGKVPGLSSYRAKWFGGGYVFQSYELKFSIQHAWDMVRQYYR